MFPNKHISDPNSPRRNTIHFTMASYGLLFATLLVCSHAAEIITKDGNIVLIVDSPGQTVSIATKAEYANDEVTLMHQAVTMVRCPFLRPAVSQSS
jgi:hypothetical protein